MKRATIAFVVVTIISIGAGVFVAICYAVCGVTMYDYNFDAFRSTLSPAQGTAIVRTAQSMLSTFSILLAVTNVLWFVFAFYLLDLLKASRKAEVQITTTH